MFWRVYPLTTSDGCTYFRGCLRPPVFRASGSFAGHQVQVSDDLRHIVVFIGVDDDPHGEGIRCIGTGLLVAYDDFRYLVTVKHNMLPLDGAPYKLRLNKSDGGSANILVDENDITWFEHSDRDVDLAIAPLPYDLKAAGFEVKYLAVPRGYGNVFDGWQCGAFCYTIGLFQLLAGQKRNLPVVHTGNLALLPGDERIPMKDWENPLGTSVRQVNGFLVEQQSISGLSGAPVFARPLVEWADLPTNAGAPAPVILPRRDLSLLGVWQGAWDAPPDEIRAVMSPLGAVRVPLGMGVVVPAIKIVEISRDARTETAAKRV